MKLSEQLRKGIEQRRQYLINKLLDFDYEKTGDGLLIQNLTLTELEQIHLNVKCRIARGLQTR